MQCPQCSAALIEPRDLDKYCEECGFPDENLAVYTLTQIKAYMHSMFEKQKCVEDVRISNHRLACAYNLLTDEHSGIAAFCENGHADGLTLDDFCHVPL